ncbi:MAG: ATP-binding protein [Aquabacterium sp.]
MSTPVATVRPALSESLKEQIELSRTRMLVGHMPRATLTVGGFAFVVIAMVCVVLPHPMNLAMSLWLFSAVAVAVLRTAHAIAYLRSQQRQARHWRPTFLAMTLALGLVWAILPWVLPIENRTDLTSSVVGSMIGMAATGASMLGFDRLHTRAWITPVLLSAVAYCGYVGGALGGFGGVSVAGFLVMLWLESDRAHRRMGEMLRLRYESEQLAQARAQALQEAESLSEAKSRFLATMSHEMRTPLHGILGLSRMLRSELQSSTAHAQMSLLQNAGEHLLGVINDVLDFTRLKENKLALRPQPLDLQALVQGVCDLADATARDKGVVVTMASNLPADLRVSADGDRLRQILTNLVGNAVKYTDQGHVIVRLSLAQPASDEQVDVVFQVEDTGHGIPPEQLGRIFDAFHQVEQGRDRLGGGTGLGLSIAQQICTAMGSRILCESRPHIGSVFSFTLCLPRLAAAEGLPSDAAQPDPAALRPAAIDAEATSETAPTALRGTVLMAEDNPVNALVAQAMLEQLGLGRARGGKRPSGAAMAGATTGRRHPHGLPHARDGRPGGHATDPRHGSPAQSTAHPHHCRQRWQDAFGRPPAVPGRGHERLPQQALSPRRSAACPDAADGRRDAPRHIHHIPPAVWAHRRRTRGGGGTIGA